MKISLRPTAVKMIREGMKRGGYATVDDVVMAGLFSLAQQERAAEFAPGELERLLAVADAEIERGELIDGEAAFRFRRLVRKRKAKR